MPPTARPRIAISVLRQVELNISGARPVTVAVDETLSVIGVTPHLALDQRSRADAVGHLLSLKVTRPPVTPAW